MSNILGISAYYHDSAACLIKNGEIISAVQEERFTRKKHDPGFPANSLNYCLLSGKISPQDIDYVVFYDKPFLKFDRIMETYLAFAPRGFESFRASLPVWIKDKLFQKYNIINNLEKIFGYKEMWEKKLLFSEHHLSHAASAYYPSPYGEAAILTMDGVGEWATTSLAHGIDNKISTLKEIHFPHSIGLLYSAFTYYAGFKVNSGEYKLMGLAPYGNPVYKNLIKDNLIDIKNDGSFALNIDYFDFCTGLTMTNDKFNNLFNGKPRVPESEITQREMDLAASIQSVTEEVVIKLARESARITNSKNLCLAGGVALNCVANGKLLKENIFQNIWVQPASGDAGGALGAALAVHHMILGNSKKLPMKGSDCMKGSYLGPEFSQQECIDRLNKIGAVFEILSDHEVIEQTAQYLSRGFAVGWMSGRMEFGPRALGSRSIIADPRLPSMQKQLNLKVKFRESFRPFAPSILIEDVNKWFDINCDSPYMMFVGNVVKDKCWKMKEEHESLFGIQKLNISRSEIPAVTHIDYSARIQTVHKETNPKYYALIKRFKEITNCPVLINTSFNIRGEPIVCSPEDAYRCFMGTGLDCLVIGNLILLKKDQKTKFDNEYKNTYKLD